MKLSVKRRSASAPDDSSSSSAGVTRSSPKPRASSLRSSSRRLCSRRASRSSAARLHAAGSVTSWATSGLERRSTLLLDDLGGGARRFLRQQLRANLLFDVGRDVLVREEK